MRLFCKRQLTDVRKTTQSLNLHQQTPYPVVSYRYIRVNHCYHYGCKEARVNLQHQLHARPLCHFAIPILRHFDARQPRHDLLGEEAEILARILITKRPALPHDNEVAEPADLLIEPHNLLEDLIRRAREDSTGIDEVLHGALGDIDGPPVGQVHCRDAG